jgi:hypothetical protein
MNHLTEDLRGRFAEQLQGHGFEPVVAWSVSDELVDLFEQTRSWDWAEEDLRALIPGVRMAIKNEELDLYGAAIDGVIAASTGGLLFGESGKAHAAGAIVGAVSTCLRLSQRLVSKGVRLSREDFALVSFLRSASRPLSITEIEDHMQRHMSGDMTQRLRRLKDVRLRDGTAAEFVRVDANGLWSVTGI